MNISRKDFFKKSLLSLGEAVCTISDALKAPAATPMEIPDTDDFDATPRIDQVAVAYNETCLARNSGCFACMERCEPGAIKLIPGVGVRINSQLCTGCGTCEYVCPVTPKAVRMQPRTTAQTPSTERSELPPEKGESPC
jgi:ferredoxin